MPKRKAGKKRKNPERPYYNNTHFVHKLHDNLFSTDRKNMSAKNLRQSDACAFCHQHRDAIIYKPELDIDENVCFYFNHLKDNLLI